MQIRKNIKRVGECLLICFIALNLAACGSDKEKEAETSMTGNIPIIEDMEDLERGNIYIETEGGYAKPYISNTSYNSTSDYKSSDTSKVAWFTEEEWENIPTLYKGDYVILRTNTEFSEDFYFNRFVDIGYSVGLSNLEETKTGRYKFDTTSDSGQINPSSDANELLSLGNETVTIDAIGGAPVRNTNISGCKSITGLEKDKVYSADIYVGTELQSFDLTADTRILYNSQVNVVNDYEFIQAEIIKIQVPDWFNSGYYSVNGSGIFRYVAGTDIDSVKDWNYPNADSEESAAEMAEPDRYNEDLETTVDFEKDGECTVTVTFDWDINEEILPEGRTKETADPPYCIINNGDELIQLGYYTDKKECRRTFKAKKGTYPMDIIRCYGMGYEVTVEYTEEETTTTK